MSLRNTAYMETCFEEIPMYFDRLFTSVTAALVATTIVTLIASVFEFGS